MRNRDIWQLDSRSNRFRSWFPDRARIRFQCVALGRLPFSC